ANQSYGLQVARLAGLPGDVLARARKHLETLEAGAESATSPQLSLFGNTARRRESEREDRAPSEERVDPVRELLDALDPDELSPREALDFVYRLIEAGKSTGGSED
ncbi:MAG: DNA mismatch repair protein MutS, partial [Candidatus Wenzhouxiangella sp. M2_3B_020]